MESKEEAVRVGDGMRPVPFEEMLRELLLEYQDNQTLYGVTVDRTNSDIPVGPAAGPHTQLAGNLVAAYAAGASYFELKTVQVLEREQLHLKKPCIYTEQAVYNTEWSSELKIEESLSEYIKAYLLIHLISQEFHLDEHLHIQFIMSVGYDLAGICSLKVDRFLDQMKHASTCEEWLKDRNFLMHHLDWFKHIEREDIEAITDVISDTVTLSTMHGCKGSEIEAIARHLLHEKQLHIYIKMNPTLIGKEAVDEILKKQGYSSIRYPEDIFDRDITIHQAMELITQLEQLAKEEGRRFGLKLTNTFPVKINHHELEGEEMYLSGPPLYAMAIRTAAVLAGMTGGRVPISYSGGVDAGNIERILEAGICPVTLSSLLLKAGGYRNLTRLQKKVADGKAVQLGKFDDRGTIGNLARGKAAIADQTVIQVSLLKKLSEDAVVEVGYHKKVCKTVQTSVQYSLFCAKCTNCVDVCPNRANIRIDMEDERRIIHRDRLCNECGNCACVCPLGHIPYFEKFTVFENIKDFAESSNDGVVYTKQKKLSRRYGMEGPASEEIINFVEKVYKKGRISDGI